MATLAELKVKFGVDATEFDKKMSAMQRRMKGMGDTMKQFGKTMSLAITAPLVIAGAAAIKFAADFEKSMTTIETLVGIGRQEVKGMKEEVLGLAGATAQAPRDLADALFAVTSADLRGEKAMEVLELSAKGAAAGLGETKQIALAVTGIMQSYAKSGMTAARAMNTLLGTVRQGNLEASELAPTLGRITGIAAQLGISFEEVGASIATFTRLGVDSAEAVTGLRGIMSALIAPGEAAEQALAGVGSSAKMLRQEVKDKGLMATLNDLVKAFEGNEEGLVAVIPNVRALATVLGTAGAQGEAYAEILHKITTEQGLLDAAFKRTTEDASFKFEKAMAQLKTTLIEFGDILLPIVARMAEVFASAVKWISSLDATTKGWILGISAALAALGPLLIALGFFISSVLPALIIGLGALKIAFLAMMGPVGLIIAGIGILVSGFILAWNESENFRGAIKGVGAALMVLGQNIVSRFREIPTLVIAALKAIPMAFLDMFKDIGAVITAIFKGEFDKLPDLLKSAGVNLLKTNPISAVAIKLGEEFGEGMGDAFNKAFDKEITTGSSFGGSAAGGVWGEVQENIKEKVKKIGGAVGRIQIPIVFISTDAGPSLSPLKQVKIDSPFQGFIDAMKDVEKGFKRLEREGKRFGKMPIEVVTDKMSLLEEGIKANTNEVGELNHAGQALLQQYNELKKASDNFADTSGIKEMQKEMITFGDMAKEAAMKVGSEFGNMFSELGGILTKELNLSGVFDSLLSGNIAGAFGSLLSGVIDKGRSNTESREAIEVKIAGLKGEFFEGDTTTGRRGAINDEIAELLKDLENVGPEMTGFDAALDKINDTIDLMVDRMIPAIDKLLTVAIEPLEKVIVEIMEVMDKGLIGVLQIAGDMIKSVADGYVNALKTFAPLIEPMIKIIRTLVGAMGTETMAVTGLLVDILLRVLNALHPFLAAIIPTIKPLGKLAAAYIELILLMPQINLLLEAFIFGLELMTAVVEPIIGALIRLTSWVTMVIEKLTAFVSSLGFITEGIVTLFETLAGNFMAGVDKILGVVDALGDVISSVVDALSFLAPVINAFKDVLGDVLSGIAHIFNAIASVVNEIPGVNIPTISVPEFAEGGIATSPTLGIFGEAGPEALIPLSKLPGMMNGGQHITVDVTGRIEGTDIQLVLQKVEDQNSLIIGQ